MIWLIAWRNIWRNKVRSLVVILAISLGLFGTLFIVALSNGMVEQKIEASIIYEISHIQLHHPDFLQEQSPKFAIGKAGEKVSQISRIGHVTAVCSRLKTTAMATTAANGTGVVIQGIHPEEEKRVSQIHTRLLDGTYFEGDSKTDPILISKKLADKLKAKPGSKIVVTIQHLDGDIVYGLFRVAGIYKTSNTAYDEMNVFVLADDLAALIGFDPGSATEIAVLLDESNSTDQVADRIQSENQDLSVMSWKQIQPFLLALSSMMDQFTFMILIIILFAVAFGIVNTMLMAILERVRELGMLMAVGMNRRRIFMMIMLETVFLSLTGGLTGMAISAVTIHYTGIKGLNFAAWAEGLEAFGYNTLIYPTLYTHVYITLTFMVIVTGILASFYPARKAIRFKPAEAVRAET
jgi:ABC-type lipoprotein release transport system permease subunit